MQTQLLAASSYCYHSYNNKSYWLKNIAIEIMQGYILGFRV